MTTPQGSGPVIASGGSSSTIPVCKELCDAIVCVGGSVVTLPGQCCTVCAIATADAGAAPPSNQCPGLAANPPAACGLNDEDVSCSVDAECTTVGVFSSGCIRLVFGVNTASTYCTGATGAAACTTYKDQTEDCQVTQDEQVYAACTDGRCTSYAAAPTLPK